MLLVPEWDSNGASRSLGDNGEQHIMEDCTHRRTHNLPLLYLTPTVTREDVHWPSWRLQVREHQRAGLRPWVSYICTFNPD